jgi:hypothetical protein
MKNERRQRNHKKYFTIALLAIILGSGAFFGIRSKLKGSVKGSTVVIDDTGIPGWWFQKYFGRSVCDSDNCKPESDPDQDKLTNLQEYYYHSDPTNAHTIGDALNDGELVAQNIDPSRKDKISLDAVTSSENIIGESLLLDTDLRSLINESINPDNVKLPEVNELDLHITNDNSEKAISEFLDGNKKIYAKYLPNNVGNYIETVTASHDKDSIDELRKKSEGVVRELKNLTVPSEFVKIHKYNIVLFQLIPDVADVPSDAQLKNDYDATGNAWFDKSQALLTVYQKIDLESRRLQNKYK